MIRMAKRYASFVVQNLARGIQQQDRASLARGITLVESSLAEHRVQAQQLLQQLQEFKPDLSSQQLRPSFRIGLSGSPGVGKSSFIETFGMQLISKGHKVAVLAVDPSSSQTGGSILGDKTRMMELSKHPNAYVRPSPTQGNLGGVARSTAEAMLLCEASGYDVVIVETVGVGQSETLVADMVDMFTLLVSPSGGDELQGIKKGIVEIADLIVVNKADGDLMSAAMMTQIEYVSALKLLKAKQLGTFSGNIWRVPVRRASAKENTGLDKVWEEMLRYREMLLKDNYLDMKRSQQRKKWMWRIITDSILYKLKYGQQLRPLVITLEKQVIDGSITPSQAASEILEAFLSKDSNQ
ncbi:hypothetical protein MP228_009736 [Amoeboaphelidium protococcarum]|nr:hypothetical protein MP228_009736 [Amoeboaphelidium protococcarum]